MKRLMLAAAVVLLVAPASGAVQAAPPPAESSREDQALVERVRASLATQFGDRRAARVAISAHAGTVRVEAPELSLRDRERVEKTVREVPGVRGVVAIVGTVLRPPTAGGVGGKTVRPEIGTAGVVGEKGRLPSAGAAGIIGEKGRLPAHGTVGIVGEKGRLPATGTAGIVGEKGRLPAAGTAGIVGEKSRFRTPASAGIIGEKSRFATPGAAIVGEKGRLPAGSNAIIGEKGRTPAAPVRDIARPRAAPGRAMANATAADAGSTRLDDATLVEMARKRLVEHLGERDAARVGIQARDGVVIVEPARDPVPDARRVAGALAGLAGMRRLDNRLQP